MIFTQEFLEDFWSRVEVDWDNPDACWLWDGDHNGGGYGRFHGTVAHRVAWEIANKREIPPGFLGCHHCDNPPCVNPWHIFLGTTADNTRDYYRKAGVISKQRYKWVRQQRIERNRHNGSGKLYDLGGGKNNLPEVTEMVQDVRKRHAAGETMASIGASLGISKQSVSYIVRRITYAWVD